MSTGLSHSKSSHGVRGKESGVNEVPSERVTIRLTGALGRYIQELEAVTAAGSPSEVVRRAITVYHTLVMQKLAGNDPVILSDDNGARKKLPIFL